MKTIGKHFQDILNDTHSWDYYGDSWNFMRDIDYVFRNPDHFIQSYLENGKKLSDRTYEQIYKLNDSNRVSHTVSIFLLGILIYERSAVVKEKINDTLQRMKTISARKQSDYIDDSPFSYYWFLICFFHDLGYCYENKSIEETTKYLVNILDGRLSLFIPGYPYGIPREVRATISKYSKYRCMEFNCFDHGIIGGKLFFEERKADFFNRQEKYKSDTFIDENRLWSISILNNIHIPVAWIIAAHNVWFIRSTEENANKYEQYGLEKLIRDNPSIHLKQHSLLWLLSLVDSIDPIKLLNSENPELSIEEIMDRVNLLITPSSITIHFNNMSNSERRYIDKINGLDNWLSCNITPCNNGIEISF